MKKMLSYAIHIWAIAFIIIVINLYVVPLIPSYAGQEQNYKSKQVYELVKFFINHRMGSSPDYALVKNGHDFLAVFFGYADDRQTCLMAAEEYNGDPSLSILPGTYQCVPLNE